jgi:hypothetical protein
MSQSTPLDKLDGPGQNDASLVSKILADMNTGGSDAGSPNAAAFQQQGPPRLVLQEPPISSTQEYTMDPSPATAHMIGNSAPSAQDFSSMMGSYSQIPQQNPAPQLQMPAPTQKGDMWSYMADRIRAPIVVAALFFLLNLPLFHTSIMQYAPWAFRAGSELSMVGLVLLSLIAGLLFAGYQLLSDIIGV